MKLRSRILAGTTLGVLMASASLVASAGDYGRPGPSLSGDMTYAQPRYLAQAEGGDEQSGEQVLKKKRKHREPAPGQASEQSAPKQAPAQQIAPKQAPAQAVAPPKAAPGEVAPAGEKQAKQRKQKRQAPGEQPAEIAPKQAPAQAAAPPKAAPGEAAPGKKQAKQDKGKQQAPSEKPGPEPEQAARPEAPVAEQPAQSVEQQDQPGKASASTGQAPVLDSQKHSAPESKQAAQRPAKPNAQQAQPTEPTPPLPADDRAAQQAVQPARIQPVTAEKGTRIDLRPEQAVRVRPQGVEVVREFGERTIVQVNNQIIVQSNDRPRIAYGAREVYYEELSRGRVREVIVREDGSRVVTIRDRYGDVVRRSRLTPDGREYVLVYVDEDYYDRVGEWRDPGLDLPPMWLTIPPEEYILDADRVDDPDAYYAFLEQPPVEPVERLYSIDEVKRSARIRDKVRRIDLDTVNFAFGSAEIEESEIPKLDGVAQAMQRLLKERPAETFLIEGHTDAVGSDHANLVLSDKRAEAVANALTNVFAIAPENLAPQGYGEQFLKVDTQERERENRRVAIRRVTPLVAPVASAD